MPAGVSAFVALATTTLASSSGTVTFSSIPGTYRDLRIVSMVTSLSGTPTAYGSSIRLNNDTGSNYSTIYAYGNGSSTGSGAESGTSASLGQFPASGGIDHLDIMDYSTDKHKTMLGRADGNGASTWMYSTRWASTAAVTSITITAPDLGADTFQAGSTFSLYGVTA